MFGQEYEYDVTYKSHKNACEEYEKVITIDIQDYIDSYAEEMFLLGQSYDKSIVNTTIYPNKKQFVMDTIHNQIGEKIFIPMSTVNSLINNLDQDAESYLEEIDYPIEDE